MAKRMTKYETMTEEVDKVTQASAAVKKKMEATGNQTKALLGYVEGEIKKLKAEPPSTTRDRKIYLNELRRQGALCNMELLDTIAAINPNAGIGNEILAHIDALTAKSHYLVIDYQTTSYRRIIDAIEQALQSEGGTGPLAPSAPAAAAPGRGTGSLKPGAPAGPNRLQQNAAGRVQPGPRVPPSPQAGTGRLQPPARPAGTGPLKPGAPAQAGGSGRLPTGPLKPGQPRPGTGSLAGRGRTGQLPADDPAMAAITKAVADPASRQLLQELVSRHQDLETTIAQMRGDGPGTLGVSLMEVGALVKQAAAKVYYLERVLQQLGPIGEQIPFQNWNTDPQVIQMLQSVAAEPAAAGKQPQQQEAGVLSGFLKSLFK